MATALSKFKASLFNETQINWNVVKANFERRWVLCPDIEDEVIINLLMSVTDIVDLRPTLHFAEGNILILHLPYIGFEQEKSTYKRSLVYYHVGARIIYTDLGSDEMKLKSSGEIMVAENNFKVAVNIAIGRMSSEA